MNYPADLSVGDIIGFEGEEVVRWKTDGLAGHVAVWIGDGKVVTSLTQTGVGIYDLAQNGQMVWVRRPVEAFDLSKAMVWFDTVKGTPYGWMDISSVADIKAISELVEKILGLKGMDCSHTSTMFLEAGGCPQHDLETTPAKQITPRDFEITLGSKQIHP